MGRLGSLTKIGLHDNETLVCDFSNFLPNGLHFPRVTIPTPLETWDRRFAMSGLAGIWNLSGEPVSAPILQSMAHQLRHRGPDGESSRVWGSIGFAYQKMAVAPESIAESQPFRFGNTLVLLDGRIDNRDDLFAFLRTKYAVASDSPDVAFVAAAYAEWGESFAGRLDGDFALVLFDAALKHLLLARDALGARSLHYARFGDAFLFASEVKALLPHPQARTAPNEVALAEWLFRVPDASDETRTFFRDIAAVPHGGLVKVTPNNVSWTRHWEFDPSRRLHLKDHREYVEHYRATFERAVRNRMRSSYPMSATVSGGLDSSAIFCTMLDIAGKAGPPTPPIFPMAFASDHPQADERPYRRALEASRGVKIHDIPFPAGTMLSDHSPLADTWHSEGPYPKWSVWKTFLEHSVEQKARVVFGGYFGDQILTHPHYLLDLFRQARLPTFKKHLQASYDWWDTGTFSLWSSHLYGTLKGYLVPDRWRPLYHRLVRPWRQSVIPIPWFSDRFNALAVQLERDRGLLHAPPCSNHAKVLYHVVHSRHLTLRNDLEVRSEARYPCQTVYPYRDRELISFLMSVPGEEVYQAGCRGLQREASVGILPETIRTRRSKAGFNGPGSVGALADLDRTEKALSSGIAMSLGFLAPSDKLAKALDELRHQLHRGNNGLSIWWAYDLVALENWLQAFFSSKRLSQHAMLDTLHSRSR